MVRIVLFLLVLPGGLFAQDTTEYNFRNAGDYNNFIMQEMTGIVQKNVDYISATVHSDRYDELEVQRGELLRAIDTAEVHIGTMPPLDGETTLRDQAVAVLREYHNAFDLDYRSVVSLKQKSNRSAAAMEAYFFAEDRAEEKVNQATLQLRKAQQAFAQKHSMDIVQARNDAQLQARMERAVSVNSYWRTLYLCYFRVSKSYDLMWDSLERKKPDAIDRERLKAIRVIDEQLPIARAQPPFNGDIEFRDETVNLLQYFRSVATIEFKKIVDLLNKKKVEQKDINEINAIVDKCNGDQDELFRHLNAAAQDLFEKNIEKQ